jgi:muramidase (phage lysozyme)
MRPRAVLRSFRRRRTRRLTLVWLCAVLMIGAVGGWAMHRDSPPPYVDPTSYASLLNTIATGESAGNYNAYFGHSGNATVRFTDMSVEQVMQWQRSYVAQGSISSAVGRYQIIRPTLDRLVTQQHIDLQAKFDAGLQDRLAIALMERRGALSYAENKLTQAQFAANLAKEWASLPKVIGPDPAASYYSGDGVNESRVSIGDVYSAIGKLKLGQP